MTLQFNEDRIYRHLEPGLAFQLEINRLRNFELEAIPTANYRMHVYLGKAKVCMVHNQVSHNTFIFQSWRWILEMLIFVMHFLFFFNSTLIWAFYSSSVQISVMCFSSIYTCVSYIWKHMLKIRVKSQ